MRIGHVIGLHDSNAAGDDPPHWNEIRDQVVAAEEAGFDVAVFEDALTFAGRGHWEAMTIAGAVAAVTSSIELSHSVVNAALRRPAIIAWAAVTLDEISCGRYTLGIGAGNTPEDFEAFGVDADRKFSRLEESLSVIVGLLRDGSVEFEGEFERAHSPRFAPGTSRRRVPVVTAGKGPRVLRMCARHSDGWNWFSEASDPTRNLSELVAELERACDEVGRDPASLQRTMDLYSYDPLGVAEGQDWIAAGTAAEMAESILALAEFGIDEVRCDVASLPGRRAEAALAMRPVVELVHQG
jgi:alkanesulfonate monooxygenase SsuD/methylene tetrahydromethanopterin reductase-like flavin-dependent oxidoreductase (luciferase family)